MQGQYRLFFGLSCIAVVLCFVYYMCDVCGIVIQYGYVAVGVQLFNSNDSVDSL